MSHLKVIVRHFQPSPDVPLFFSSKTRRPNQSQKNLKFVYFAANDNVPLQRATGRIDDQPRPSTEFRETFQQGRLRKFLALDNKEPTLVNIGHIGGPVDKAFIKIAHAGRNQQETRTVSQ